MESTRVNDSPARKFRLILECYLSDGLTKITGNVCKARESTEPAVSKALVNILSSKDQGPCVYLAGKGLLAIRSPSKDSQESSPAPQLKRRANQSILKETGPEYSLEGLMLKLKLQYFGHLM